MDIDSIDDLADSGMGFGVNREAVQQEILMTSELGSVKVARHCKYK